MPHETSAAGKEMTRIRKPIRIRFERDPDIGQIEVVIRAPEQDASVTELMEMLSGRTQEAIMAYDDDRNVRTISPDDIVLASAEGKQVRLDTVKSSFYTRQTLSGLEEILNGRQFVRISRYEIVNLDYVKRYDFTIAGTLRIELTGGKETWASRRCIPAIRRRLKGKE